MKTSHPTTYLSIITVIRVPSGIQLWYDINFSAIRTISLFFLSYCIKFTRTNFITKLCCTKVILIKPGQLFTLVTLMNYKAKYNSSSNCNELDKVCLSLAMVYTGKDGNLPYTWKYSSPFYFRTCRPWCMSPCEFTTGRIRNNFYWLL